MSKKARITPVKGFLVLEVLENESPNSFDVADNDQIPQRGRVLAVGTDTLHESGDVFKSPCKVGDTVIHSGFGYEDVYIDGERYRMCPFGKVLGIV